MTRLTKHRRMRTARFVAIALFKAHDHSVLRLLWNELHYLH